MKKDDLILLLAGLGGAVAIVALAIPLVLAFMQPKPEKPAGIPESFSFDYPIGEYPGKRHWSKIDKDVWKETYPGEKIFNKFKEVGRAKFDKCEGTVVEREGATSFKVLIADRNCENKWLFFRIGNGEWKYMGEMHSVK
ncbi:hypothetical protein D3C77_242110 [compost metagenome]|jgi:hypothetical protein